MTDESSSHTTPNDTKDGVNTTDIIRNNDEEAAATFDSPTLVDNPSSPDADGVVTAESVSDGNNVVAVVTVKESSGVIATAIDEPTMGEEVQSSETTEENPTKDVEDSAVGATTTGKDIPEPAEDVHEPHNDENLTKLNENFTMAGDEPFPSVEAATGDATVANSAEETKETETTETAGQVNAATSTAAEGETESSQGCDKNDVPMGPPPAPLAVDDSQNGSTGGGGTSETPAPSTPLGQSKGAQILMNRFSTWRMTANESAVSLLTKTQANAALQENAKQAQEYAQRMRLRFQQTMRVSSSTTTSDNKADAAVEKSNEDDRNHVVQEKVEPEKNDSEPPQGTVSAKSSSSTDDDEEDESLERNESQDSKTTYTSGNTGDHSSMAGGDEDIFSEATSDGTGTTSSTMNPYTRDRMIAVLSRASVAGSVVAESVATSFRGRYTADAAAPSATDGTTTKDAADTPSKPVPESQVELILKSRVGEHMQETLNQLERHEFAMLLGRGMMGVNLKQCYLKNHGIFVDYLVVGGQAQQSGLVRTGDLLVRLGDMDLRKGTIQEVPKKIAQAKRPSVFVMATGTPVPLERVNYVDVAVAMMHRVRKYLGEQNKSSPKSESRQVAPTNESREIPGKEEKIDDPMSATPKSVSNVKIPVHDTVDAFVSPPWPNLEIRKEFIDEAPLRCHDKFVVSELSDMLDMDSNFRAAIQNAFLVCALDSRRLPFLARHFSGEEFHDADSSSSMTPSAKLMLFLELASFLDLYEVTPIERLRETASRIAYKFFLPTKIGNRLQPPLFDFHHIAPDSSLRHLEFVLNGKSQIIPKDLFLDFQKAVVDSLTSAAFLSFLCSADCARMRAYLRDTSPFINLPLKAMVDAVCLKTGDSSTPQTTDGSPTSIVGASKSCLAYNLLYLICRMEKETSGEYDFGFESDDNRRLIGAPNDLCCSIFIQRDLLPILKTTKENIDSYKDGESAPEVEKLVSVVERFWDLYVADTLELSTKRTEIESSYDKVRMVLQGISEKVVDSPSLKTKDFAKLILDSKLEETAKILADELLYEYASNLNTKFRDNKVHEWMCSELCKVVASDPSWYKTMPIPQPPPGCLKRMLRKAELPVGISSHKPYRENKATTSEQQNHNAEWAVVFGSTVGSELASQMPVPGLDNLDVRRYTCLPVALGRDHNFDDFRPEEVLPATFESYAVVPPSKLKPFRSLVDADRMSVDGWEISLITFTMPNADSTSSSGDATESALFGVSLCFQRSSTVVDDGHLGRKIQTEIHFSDPPSDTGDSCWISPISFENIADSDDNVIRKIKSTCDAPIFSRRLREQPWTERVMSEEHRDQSQPIMIGIALVSRRNVVFAMRDTLSRLLFDFSRRPGQSIEDIKDPPSCNALVEVLGAFSYQDHEGAVLKSILEPYIRHGSSPWIDHPIAVQEKAFESHALKLLTDCLPPIPLALLFVTVLLEQKVVFSSSRRSVLHAACSGLAVLLRPLKWSHLFVPLVPGALAGDLIQYPAPFILGVPSEDADNMDLLGSLPRDVTLVDLDVGRVILAPDFGKDNEMVRGTQDADATARALRSQVLYLAQGLGTVFGNSLRPDSWRCDGISAGRRMISDASDLDRLREVVKSFVTELLEGSASCCFWFEDVMQTYGSASEPTVLFDEDKFFQIKHHRATKAWKHLFPRDKNTGTLALNLDDFDLILESFLRCQNLSLHINTLPKTDMFYH
ncbi:DENN AEX-3 domain containing protein [Nitzschia inconspicua]|uniref:DENN AEX-3 domain containing protein n=1 Tax=Nitzschia inconspicua TaxID=303405 RepID=A0A9K3PP19_9STRA|nr:DENN AEX-3 domain containing protein [Nitzschia inconspicua]